MSDDISARLQTMQPKFHLRIAWIFIAAVAILVFLAYARPGFYRFEYAGVAALTAGALLFHYRKERRIVQDRLSAVGIVTDYSIPLRGKSRFLNFILSKFSPEVPRIKYSFVAFDQKTYTGQTGWGGARFRQGSPITILYRPGNPAVNHPLTSFIFYSFR